jgi:hypothetical protein
MEYPSDLNADDGNFNNLGVEQELHVAGTWHCDDKYCIITTDSAIGDRFPLTIIGGFKTQANGSILFADNNNDNSIKIGGFSLINFDRDASPVGMLNAFTSPMGNSAFWGGGSQKLSGINTHFFIVRDTYTSTVDWQLLSVDNSYDADDYPAVVMLNSSGGMTRFVWGSTGGAPARQTMAHDGSGDFFWNLEVFGSDANEKIHIGDTDNGDEVVIDDDGNFTSFTFDENFMIKRESDNKYFECGIDAGGNLKCY